MLASLDVPLALRTAAALALAALAACTTPTVRTRYEPLHPPDNTAIDFRVIASDSDGIAGAELFLYEYELSIQGGMQTATARPGGIWGLAQSWNYSPSQGSIDQTYTHPGFPAGSWIKFLFRVTDVEGDSKSESWTFAAGAWPFGNSPIPLLANGAPAERIDVCFVADDTDFASGAVMLPSLTGLIFDGYHTNNMIRGSYRDHWQFYYSPETGFISDFDSPPLSMTIPASVTNSAIIDHAAVIHTTVKRDWASGGNFGTEPTNIGTAVHESAHAAFGLKDEYAGGGHGTSSDPHHNNYDSEGAAQNYNASNGWPTGDVENIEGSWWRPEPSSLDCIMIDDGDAAMPEFARTCINRIIWFYSQL